MENYGHRTATTVNGVVINIQGDSHTTKVGGKRVRRDASFRVPPPASFNGAGRASSPTLSSASGSPYPASANAPPMNNVPVESVRARALQVRYLFQTKNVILLILYFLEKWKYLCISFLKFSDKKMNEFRF